MTDPPSPEDCHYLAALLKAQARGKAEAQLRATLRNNLNTIIAALEVAGEALSAPEYGVDAERDLVADLSTK